MRVYVVQNKDDIVFGVFKKKRKAKACAKIGKEIWNEGWTVTKYKLNKVSDFLMQELHKHRRKNVR